MKKKMLSLLVVLSAAVAFADGMVLSKPVQISSHYEQLDMRNILKMPVWGKLDIDLGDTSKASTTGQIEVPREMIEGVKCAALRVSHLIVHTKGKIILGALSSNVYPTIDEGVFAVTNDIASAGNDIPCGKAMVIPTQIYKDKGYAETIYFWKPDPTKTRELELIVRQYVSPKKQMAVACCLHNRGDGIRGELATPPKKK